MMLHCVGGRDLRLIMEPRIGATITSVFAWNYTQNVVGICLAQNYETPNLAIKIECIKKDVDAKKILPPLNTNF